MRFIETYSVVTTMIHDLKFLLRKEYILCTDSESYMPQHKSSLSTMWLDQNKTFKPWEHSYEISSNQLALCE